MDFGVDPSIGKIASWSNGVLEECQTKEPNSFQYSTTPVLQFSIAAHTDPSRLIPVSWPSNHGAAAFGVDRVLFYESI